MSVTRPETGLPKLPAGQWWRVARVEGNTLYTDESRYVLNDYLREQQPTHYEVQIIKHALVERPVNVSRGWWRRSYQGFVSEQVEVVHHRRTICTVVKGEAPYHAGYLEYPDELTPDLVLEAAEALLKQVEAAEVAVQERAARAAERRAARRRSEGLLGDYPPKTLPAVNRD